MYSRTVRASEGSSYRGRLKKKKQKTICRVAVTFSIKGKGIQSEFAGNSSYPSSS